MKKTKLNIIQDKFYDVVPWIALSITGLSTPNASTAIKKLTEKFIFGIDTALKQNEMYPSILYIVVFIIATIWLYSLRRHLFKARTQGMKNVDNPERRQHLILFLSNIHERQLSNYTEQLIPKGLELENIGLQSLEKDFASIAEHKKNHSPWSWEMPLRAIRYHIGDIESPTLKSITVMCSHASIIQLPQFGEIVKNYLKETTITLKILADKNSANSWGTWTNSAENKKLVGYDFEDFDELTSALHWYVKQLRKNKVKEKDIVIDFTGGQKVTSVVASTLTFNSRIKAQYISTITSHVKGYDVIYGTSNFSID